VISQIPLDGMFELAASDGVVKCRGCVRMADCATGESLTVANVGFLSRLERKASCLLGRDYSSDILKKTVIERLIEFKHW